MTPTEQDKELRRLISDLMADLMVDVSLKKLSKYDGDIIEKGRLYLESHNDRLNLIMQLITADRKRVALEARIDEIKLTKDNSEESYLGEDWWADESIKDNSAHEVPLSYFENRIAELKAQQEKL